jgi:hypothetical protein
MDEQNLDFEDFEDSELEFEASPPEAFYLALCNALQQLKHQPVEAPSLH